MKAEPRITLTDLQASHVYVWFQAFWQGHMQESDMVPTDCGLCESIQLRIEKLIGPE